MGAWVRTLCAPTFTHLGGVVLDLPPPVAEVAIDADVWLPASSIRWPSSEHAVAIYEGTTESGSELHKVAADRYEFKFIQVGDRLVVVMGLHPGLNGGRQAREFVSAHESFHIAAQLYGARIPLNYLEIAPELVATHAGAHAFEFFYDAIDTMHAEVARGAEDVDCSALEETYAALEEGARTYLNYKIFWEWPAEFYSYSVTFAGRLGEYEAFRARLFPDDTGYRLFTAGVKVARMLEAKLPRAEWQAQVADGRSMLAVLAATYQCRLVLDEGPAVTVVRVGIP